MTYSPDSGEYLLNVVSETIGNYLSLTSPDHLKKCLYLSPYFIDVHLLSLSHPHTTLSHPHNPLTPSQPSHNPHNPLTPSHILTTLSHPHNTLTLSHTSCKGIEHFLLQVVEDLPDVEFLVNTFDYPMVSTTPTPTTTMVNTYPPPPSPPSPW